MKTPDQKSPEPIAVVSKTPQEEYVSQEAHFNKVNTRAAEVVAHQAEILSEKVKAREKKDKIKASKIFDNIQNGGQQLDFKGDVNDASAVTKKSPSVLSEKDFLDYTDKDEVSMDVLRHIANKIVGLKELSYEEGVVYSGRTSQVEDLIQAQKKGK